ncbi:hypothetical protein [Lactobacillus apis] [Lactiplantibacillus mudanjiangensis]|uniref:LysR family transcriptional regulator n=1 Tax=Lactiplantibacillus mudanjiangensis TaxID=1296538 RepID=UPI0010154619|nr:hypothetical protein [Lactobacillus apis] [Lactiplantibacillus mudanjiangensis]
MQIHDLEVFQTLYERRSINQTAKVLRYSQSNITARLKALEAELQTPLFIRSYQGLQPTKAGELTYQYTQTVLQATRQLRTQLQAKTKIQTVTISSLLFNYLVVQQRRYSLTNYQFKIASSTAIATATHLDDPLVITYANFQNDRYLLSSTDWLTTQLLSSDGEIDKRPYLVNSDQYCPFRQRTLAMATDTDQVLAIDSWESLIELVQQGQGVALLPKYLVAQKQLVPVADSNTIKLPYRTYLLKNNA